MEKSTTEFVVRSESEWFAKDAYAYLAVSHMQGKTLKIIDQSLENLPSRHDLAPALRH